MAVRVWPGSHLPLGATWDGEGVNFAIYSEHATSVELCMFDTPFDEKPSNSVLMPAATDRIWHAYLPDARPGTLYAYRIDGPYAPDEGQRFNAHKLLLDPYAKAVTGNFRWSDELYGYTIGDPDEDLSFDERDSAPSMPRCVVVDQAFTWGDDRRPNTPWNTTIVYECHVRGMTIWHPAVPDHLKGTYLGLASDPVIDHLLSLGVTAVELMPVHQFIPERELVERGLTNYWGYNSIAFFAPHAAYASGHSGEQVTEFKSMVKTLHRAGIEVILDVVYNHTAEGNEHGATLSLRGIDNSVYYRLNSEDPRHHIDFTGTGNSLNIVHPRTMALVMDSLRYWVTDMHVDGFRFDLAPVLIRGIEERRSSFFEIVQQDPVLSQVKLIAEPWDAGPGGYQLGNFPPGWAEWNGAFRDCVRQFWRGDSGRVPELASRLTGSSDIYAPSGRRTYASVNFVACHDGFSLDDVVSYDHKHNEANGHDNTDGTEENYSRNWGVEGPTESVRILRLRDRMKRNLLATTFFSQGVRMFLSGDELSHSRQGNNNPYCQDNGISWLDWDLDESSSEFLEFTRDLSAIVRANPVLRRRDFFTGDPVTPGGMRDVTWIKADGEEMTDKEWADPEIRSIGMLLSGRAVDDVDIRGRAIYGDTLLLLLNSGTRSRLYTLPRLEWPGMWEQLLNTGQLGRRVVRGQTVNLTSHSLILLRYNQHIEA